jgi:hypothetical protein
MNNNNNSNNNTAAVDTAAAAAAAAEKELESGELTVIATAAAQLQQPRAKYAGAGEYLINLGRGTLATLIKDFTPPKSEKKAAGWAAPKMPAGLTRVKIVCASYAARAIAGADIADGDKITPTYGVHTSRYTLRLSFGGKTALLTDFAARVGLEVGEEKKYYSTGAARLDKMVTLWKLMRDAWNLNAKGEPKK